MGKTPKANHTNLALIGYANAALSQFMNIKCDDKLFRITFQQTNKEDPLRSHPDKQPMGGKDNWDRCMLTDAADYAKIGLKPFTLPAAAVLPEMNDDDF